MASGGATLFERAAELARLRRVAQSAQRAVGGAALIEGQAGIGKTALLRRTQAWCRAEGMMLLAAEGAPLEREIGFGVARRLLEATVRRLSAEDQTRVLGDAARLARPVVLPETRDQAPTDQAAVLHGLYWLTANLVERAPTLIAVDDVHWADRASLHFLAYLLRRLEGLPLAVVMALRSGEPGADAALAELLATPALEVITPPQLSLTGVRSILRQRIKSALDEHFVVACSDATSGVPFLVHELAKELDRSGIPTAADRVASTVPRSVTLATGVRLSREPDAVLAVARAVAVLTPHARLDRVARLARRDRGTTRASADALIRMELLVADSPLRFIHPLIHRAVHDSIPSSERSDLHARAARLLMAEHAHAEAVAAHSLATAPTGQTEIVEQLRVAAFEATGRGTPESAVTYLRRALAEGAAEPPSAVLLYELGCAEQLAGDPESVDTLEQALTLTDDQATQAKIASQLADLHLLRGNWTARLDVINDILQRLAPTEAAHRARLEAARLATELNDPRYANDVEQQLTRYETSLDDANAATRNLAIAIAAFKTLRLRDHDEALPLLQRGLDAGRIVGDEGSESPMVAMAIWSLMLLDRLDDAESAGETMMADARRRGSLYGYCIASWVRGWLHLQRGELKAAEAHHRVALELAVQNGWLYAIPAPLLYGVDLLIARPELGDLSELAETTTLEGPFAGSTTGAFLLTARGRLRLERGRREEAVADLRAAGVIWTALRIRNTLAAPWRRFLALALPPESLEEANELVLSELDDAKASGLARPEGIALRVAGLLTPGRLGIDRLEESLHVLGPCPAPLELALTRIELGAALRRSDHRIAAREHLRTGLELAYHCGATRFVERARAELNLAGARPRRPAVTGPDALTAAEARVARMAADGMTNREIAQALFVTAKTIENQLGSAYQKLGVSSRRSLIAALSTKVTDTSALTI